MHGWNPQISDSCWRCGREKGTLVHIWWQCSHIAQYWEKVIRLIRQITDTSLTLNVATCLLHVTNFSLKRYKNSLTRHLLNAAKSLIPLYWRSQRVPSIAEWLRRVSEVHGMEETLAQASDRVDKLHKIWQPWVAFRYSSAYPDGASQTSAWEVPEKLLTSTFYHTLYYFSFLFYRYFFLAMIRDYSKGCLMEIVCYDHPRSAPPRGPLFLWLLLFFLFFERERKWLRPIIQHYPTTVTFASGNTNYLTSRVMLEILFSFCLFTPLYMGRNGFVLFVCLWHVL